MTNTVVSQKWEYVTVPLQIHSTTEILNLWGKKGYELVQVITTEQGGLVAFMKKPQEQQ